MANSPKKPVSKAAPRAAKSAAPKPAAPLVAAHVAKAAETPVEEPVVQKTETVEEPVMETSEIVAEDRISAPSAAPLWIQEDVNAGANETLIETAAVIDAPTATQEGTYIMTDVIETGKKFAADAKAKVETVVAEFNVKAKAAAEKSAKLFEEMGDLTKGNVEAIVESSKIAAKGVETMGQGAAEYSRKQFEKSSATMKSFASIKSPAEFFQLQSELLSSAFDSFASEASKNSEAMLKLVGEIAQPLSTRVSVVTDKVKALAA